MFRGINPKDVSWAKLKLGNLEQSSDDADIAGLAPSKRVSRASFRSGWTPRRETFCLIVFGRMTVAKPWSCIKPISLSGGKVTSMEIGDFLGRGKAGPEH
jgi:hypothetical protein